MSLRTKLFIAFTSVILIILAFFSAVAFTSARDYTQHNGQILAQKESQFLINQLSNDKTPTLEQIKWFFPASKNTDQFYIIVNQQTNDIVNNITDAQLTLFKNKKPTTVAHTSPQQIGTTKFNDENYIWARNHVPNTSYDVISAYRNTENNVEHFLEFISTPLIITLFTGIWVALWSSVILSNLIQKVEEKNSQLKFQSRHDPLTKLPNRDAIFEVTQQAIESAMPTEEELIVCLIDIDALKEINDTLGHENGDILLSQITQRLKKSLRSSDYIGRFGGNKFAVILHHTQTNNIEAIGNKLLESFEGVFEINGHSLYVRAILGISVFPDHADNSLTLIQKAETALHKARKMALDFAIYDVSLDKNSADRLKLTHDLRNAIHNEELKLYYQPQLDTRSGTIKSVEALARWIHPTEGFIPPDIFIEIAEQTGLIQPLTDWVLRTALEQCANWLKMGVHLTVSVNLSARNLHDETLGQQVSNLLNYWNLSPSQLCLEITETSMMTDPEHARLLLDGLDKLGVRISIDDFGTGYSSLAYIKELPVDELKVDKSFVLNMAKDENDASIVRATVSLAHDLGLEVVAEGVEDQDSQDALQKLGCEFIQGYHFARPMPPADLTPILIESKASNDEHQPAEQPTLLHP